MLRIYHLKVDDLGRDDAFALCGGPNPDRPTLVAQAIAKGCYEPVAELDMADAKPPALEVAYTLTQNGGASPSWSRQPPTGLRPLTPTILLDDDGREYGRRSTMVGDVIENVETSERFVVDWVGFLAMPVQETTDGR